MTSTSPSQSVPAYRGMAFEHALRSASEIAACSPSSHNCQPWAVGWALSAVARRSAAALLDETAERTPTARADAGRHDAEYLILALDTERQLGALASHSVEMLISCGAYGEILLRSLAAEGWSADRVRFVADATSVRVPGAAGTERMFGERWPEAWTALCVIRLEHTGTPPEDLAELRETVRARHTNRGPYRLEGIDSEVLAELETQQSAAAFPRAAEGGPKVVLRHVVSDTERAAIADLVSRHGGRDFSHREAWQETHSFIRRDAADAETRGDGFTLAHLFGPLSPQRRLGMRIALAPPTMRILRHAGYHRLLARRLAATVRRSPAAVALCFEDEAPDAGSVVRGGAVLADYWLGATRAGLVLHPVSVLLQHDDVRTRLEQRLGLPGRAFFVSRLGRAVTAFPPSHRLATSRVLRLV